MCQQNAKNVLSYGKAQFPVNELSSELATEEKNDDISAEVRLKRRNHRFTDVSCSRAIKNSALFPEKPWINPCKKQFT